MLGDNNLAKTSFNHKLNRQFGLSKDLIDLLERRKMFKISKVSSKTEDLETVN
jgi:hypothetical protein